MNICVIGGGFTGLFSALLLAKNLPKCQIKLLLKEDLKNIQDARTLVLMPSSIELLKHHKLDILSMVTNCAIDNTFITLGHTVKIATPNQPHIVSAQDLHNMLVEETSITPNIITQVAKVTNIDDKWQVQIEGRDAEKADLICSCAGSAQLTPFAMPISSYDFTSNAWVYACDSVDTAQKDAYIIFKHNCHISLLPKLLAQQTGVISAPADYKEKEVKNLIIKVLAEQNKPINNLQLLATHPLHHKIMHPRVNGCVVLLGHAAHQIHPVGAQGLNLTLRTLGLLVEALKTEKPIIPTLQKYAHATKQDIKRTAAVTKFIACLPQTVWRLPATFGIKIAAKKQRAFSWMVHRLLVNHGK